jgi:DNA-binding IclR family transcriptional regulator
MMNDSVRSASRVLDLLEFLAGTEDGSSLTQASSSLGLPKSSTLMLLRTLLARGYVTKDIADRYRLNETFRAHGFGWGGHRFARLIALAEPVMNDLCQEVEETILLGAAEGESVRILAKVVSAQDIRYDADITKPSPMYCTAMGRLILASFPGLRREQILRQSPREKLTPSTVTDLGELQAIVERAAEDGFAIVEEEFALGGTGVAAPIFNAEGAVAAVINVACVTTRFQEKRDRLLAALLQASAKLSAAPADQAKIGRRKSQSVEDKKFQKTARRG